MDVTEGEDSSGPSSLSSDQASLCVIPDPDDSTEEDDFIYLDKTGLPESLNEQDRTVIVFHSVDEEYRADQNIVCEYIRPDKWQESLNDAIYLFKVGWVTHCDFICAVPVPQPNNDPIGRVLLPEHLLPKDTANLYQFCYLRHFTVLGASTPFQFTLPEVKRCDTNSSLSQIGAQDEANEEVEKNRAKMLTCSCSSGFSESSSDKTKVEAFLPFPEEKVEVTTQGCDYTPLQNETSFGGDSLNGKVIPCWGNFKGDTSCGEIDQNNGSMSTSSEFLLKDFTSEENKKDNNVHQQLKDESSHFKQRFEEALEEKKWLQEQYNSLLITVKKYAEDLASVRSEKESLDGHITELTISHKMLCSENARLNKELDNTKHLLLEETIKRDEILLPDIKALEEQLGAASRTNGYLTEEVVHLQTQIKELQKEKKPSQKQRQLEKNMNDTHEASDYKVLKNSLEAELQEELKLSAERDNYVAQLERTKLNDLENIFARLSSLPNTSGNIDKVREMEDNMNCTLEALECCMKELEVLRSRRAAINRNNRTLREEFMHKQEEWKERDLQQKSALDAQVRELQEQIEGERSSKLVIQKELDILKEKLNQQTVNKASQAWSQRKSVSEALDVAHKQIESLHKEKSELNRECELLKQKMEKDVNITLLKNLEEAREEYKKLYTEKIKIQEKLTRLQQKVKAKKSTRTHQDSSDDVDSAKTEFLNNVSSSWRAIVDELM